MTKFIPLSFFTYNLELYYAAMGARFGKAKRTN